MHRTKQNKKWKRYKKVDVSWVQYDRYILNECKWMKVEIILGDGGYGTRKCFNEIEKHGSLAGIKVRKITMNGTKEFIIQ